MADRRWPRVALSILGIHNLVQNSFLNERGYVAGNLVVAGLMIGVGRAAGLGWAEMGLHRGDVRRSLEVGAIAGGAGTATALLLLESRRGRSYLLDERAAGMGHRIWSRALIRFPIGTALFEEVAFRGVLPGLFRQSRGAYSAEVASAAAFGLWHLIPTRTALSSNLVGRDLPTKQRLLVIVGGSAGAGVAGLALSWVRRYAGSLLAPWAAHAFLNSLSYLAGVAAARLSSN